MSWCRLEDDMDDNRKLKRLGHEAFRLYWAAVSYSRRHQTAGRLHLSDAADVAARHGVRNLKAAIADLLYVPRELGYEAGCWEQVAPATYQIHDFGDYNPPTSKERMAKKRERDRLAATNGRVTTGDADVTSHPVTPRVTSDAPGDAPVTRSDSPRAQPRAGYPNPVPKPVPVRVPPPSELSPRPPDLPDEEAERYGALADACWEILNRPLRGDEGPLVRGWSLLRRGGEWVAVVEIANLVRWLMAQPTRDGTLPGTLRYIEAQVQVLARAPQTPWLAMVPAAVKWDNFAAELRAAEVAEAAQVESGAASLRLVDGGRT